MVAHGLSWTCAGHFGLFTLYVPDIMLGFVGGLIVGLVSRRRWLRVALLYAAGYFLAPYVLMLVIGNWAYSSSGASTLLLRNALAVFPSVICGAWLTARPRKRRREARLAAGLCVTCGYDLTGAAHERCPECGTVISNRDATQCQAKVAGSHC